MLSVLIAWLDCFPLVNCREQPLVLEMHRALHQLNQVDHVGEVADGQLHQGHPAAGPNLWKSQ